MEVSSKDFARDRWKKSRRNTFTHGKRLPASKSGSHASSGATEYTGKERSPDNNVAAEDAPLSQEGVPPQSEGADLEALLADVEMKHYQAFCRHSAAPALDVPGEPPPMKEGLLSVNLHDIADTFSALSLLDLVGIPAPFVEAAGLPATCVADLPGLMDYQDLWYRNIPSTQQPSAAEAPKPTTVTASSATVVSNATQVQKPIAAISPCSTVLSSAAEAPTATSPSSTVLPSAAEAPKPTTVATKVSTWMPAAGSASISNSRSVTPSVPSIASAPSNGTTGVVSAGSASGVSKQTGHVAGLTLGFASQDDDGLDALLASTSDHGSMTPTPPITHSALPRGTSAAMAASPSKASPASMSPFSGASKATPTTTSAFPGTSKATALGIELDLDDDGLDALLGTSSNTSQSAIGTAEVRLSNGLGSGTMLGLANTAPARTRMGPRTGTGMGLANTAPPWAGTVGTGSGTVLQSGVACAASGGVGDVGGKPGSSQPHGSTAVKTCSSFGAGSVGERGVETFGASTAGKSEEDSLDALLAATWIGGGTSEAVHSVRQRGGSKGWSSVGSVRRGQSSGSKVGEGAGLGDGDDDLDSLLAGTKGGWGAR